jgi:hypothetical protein
MFEGYKLWAAKKEVQKRVEPLKKVDDKIDYLEKMARKKSSLAPITRDALYSELGDLYLDKFEHQEKAYGRLVVGHGFDSLFKAVESYVNSGDLVRAKNLLNSNAKVTLRPADGGEDKKITLQEACNSAEYASEISREKGRLMKIIERLELKKQGKWKGGFGGYYRASTATMAIIGILGGIFFLSSNITGNVIGLNQTSSNWIGIVLFIIGIIGAFAYFKRR